MSEICGGNLAFSIRMSRMPGRELNTEREQLRFLILAKIRIKRSYSDTNNASRV